MRIAVTGATGYIGRRFVRAARLSGYEVLTLSRKPMIDYGSKWRYFNLNNTDPIDLPKDIIAVFHFAAQTSPSQDRIIGEKLTTTRLIQAAKKIKASFIFVSSQAAGEFAPTDYGRLKWEIEKTLIDSDSWIVRVGLVYGGEEAGLFGLLCMYIKRFSVLPMFLPHPHVQPIHIDNLVQGLLVCFKRLPAGVYNIADQNSISFTTFLKSLAWGRYGRKIFFIPIPTIFIKIVSKLVGKRFSIKLGLQRLLSLISLTHMNTESELRDLSLVLKPLISGVSRSGKERRGLILEGQTLLTYVLRKKPKYRLLYRYVKVIEFLRSGRSIELPSCVHKAPALVSLLEDLDVNSELKWRLNSAMMIAESCPEGAVRFLNINKNIGWKRIIAQITCIVIMETIRRFVTFSIKLLFLSFNFKEKNR